LNLLKEITESFNDPKLFQAVFASKFLKAESIEQLEDYVSLITEELALREKKIIKTSTFNQNEHTLHQKKMKMSTQETTTNYLFASMPKNNVSQCLTALHKRLAIPLIEK
jgi:hypothetical protein